MAKFETITNAGALMFSRIAASNTVFKFKGCKLYNNAVQISNAQEARDKTAADFANATQALGLTDYVLPIEILPIEATVPTTDMNRNSKVEDTAIELNFVLQGTDGDGEITQICLYAAQYHTCNEWKPNAAYVVNDACYYYDPNTSAKTYYRCTSAISGSISSPGIDPTHWTSFAIDGPNDWDATYDEKNGLVQYRCEADELIYILQFSRSLNLFSGIYVDWKIRIFMNSSVAEKVYSDGVEMDPQTVAQAGAIQLEFINELSKEMRLTRDVLRSKIGI